MEMTEDAVMWLILLFVWAEFLWELYLELRQFRIYKTNTTIPDELQDMLNEESFKKSRLYAIDRAVFSVVKDVVSVTSNSLFLYNKWYYVIWQKSEEINSSLGISPDNEISISCIFVTLLTLISFAQNLPLSFYGTFVIEEKHGFNKQTIWFFIKDKIKGLLLTVVITLPISAVCIYIVNLGSNMFVVWLWLFTVVICLILATVYPSVIAPLFDKFEPLADGSLRAGIEDLAMKLKFPLSQVYIVEGSKRSAHSNAYFTGLFGSKRIVIFDTLIEKYDEEKKVTTGCRETEILGVLAHELGHWSCNHIYKNLALTQLNLLLLFIGFGALFKYSMLYTMLGFPPGKEPVLIGLLVITSMILAPYHSILGFLTTVLSRKFEFEADNFAVSLDFSHELRSSLLKLGKDNLNYPIYDELFSTWHHSHPTLLQRIENINIQMSKKFE